LSTTSTNTMMHAISPLQERAGGKLVGAFVEGQPDGEIDQCSNSRLDGESNDVTQENELFRNGMARSRTLQSFSTSILSTSAEIGPLKELSSQNDGFGLTFSNAIRKDIGDSCDVPNFSRETRRLMEPFLRKARVEREHAQFRSDNGFVAPIGNQTGVPYVGLRSETPFLFDIETYPLDRVLATTLKVDDLSRLHEEPKLQSKMLLVRNECTRFEFQKAYDAFVTSFCIPLIHSIAMSKSIFHSVSAESSICYRYQAFPNIRILRPGESSKGPVCDTAKGHSIGCLRFHVPLTPSFGTNALYSESFPGREDWHPLLSKSAGLGFLFDGARCLHFNLENTTSSTSVALDFSITFYQDGDATTDYIDGDYLCTKTLLEDDFSVQQGYYSEATIELGIRSLGKVVVEKREQQYQRHGRQLTTRP